MNVDTLIFLNRKNFMMKQWYFTFGLLVNALSCAAWATPYWVAYEGDDLPENQGWDRYYYEPQPSSRTIDNGVITYDSSASELTYDYWDI